MEKAKLDVNEIICAYNNEPNLHKLAKSFHTSHIRLSTLLKENGVVVQNVGKKKDITNDTIILMKNDYLVNHLTTDEISKKYSIRLKRLRQIFKENGVKISKWNGHIKKEKIQRVKEKKEVKEHIKCPICGWITYDIQGKAHSLQKHLCQKHEYTPKTISLYLKEHPEHEYLLVDLKNKENKIQCKECGKWLSIIDDRHLSKHGMTKEDYVQKYFGTSIISDSCKEKLQKNLKKMYDNPNWDRFTSTYETEISNFLTLNRIKHEMHNRSILKGKEIDILCGNIGIEFNGCFQHTEWSGGKDRNYHLSKTQEANEANIKLIHIFEDEFVHSKKIVLSKILHIVGANNNLPSIYARKCSIKEIGACDAEDFMNENHIQGFVHSSIYLAAYYADIIIGVMTFKKIKSDGDEWELTRFATNNRYKCVGVGGKLFHYFIENYSPSMVKSFADRRWTIHYDNNLYIKLGFKFDGFVKPDYRYYNLKDNKPKRFHKFGFRKGRIIAKYGDKYGLTKDMTESEMAKKIGFDRIWDCGLIRYVWKKQ